MYLVHFQSLKIYTFVCMYGKNELTKVKFCELFLDFHERPEFACWKIILALAIIRIYCGNSHIKINSCFLPPKGLIIDFYFSLKNCIYSLKYMYQSVSTHTLRVKPNWIQVSGREWLIILVISGSWFRFLEEETEIYSAIDMSSHHVTLSRQEVFIIQHICYCYMQSTKHSYEQKWIFLSY